MELSYFSTGGAQTENRVLWKIFGSKCDIATGYRKLQYEVYNWYYSPHIIKMQDYRFSQWQCLNLKTRALPSSKHWNYKTVSHPRTP
jgi:hypothetical protein